MKMSVSLAGTDEQLTKLHAETEYKMSDLLCSFQDESIKRVTQLLDESNARSEQLQAEKDQLLALVDMDNIDDLGAWIVGAQSEISHLAGQLRDIWDMQSAYMRGEVPIDKITVGYVSEYDAETPLGQALDGMGDEVEP